ncbi:hypothetical protein PR202_gb19578 [Eleusine coracana subsp. coracana]|uniref:Uncharacterized protein n=1 Tax=Eleusine coracana subsp. coracana TaxID=191504 RepID=A0AAV5F8N5_ELECO|nr:hypothetical protein PR202_gb19578 [Eleusine coracana subsp. coracana]
MITEPWLVILKHLLIPIDQDPPVAMEVVPILKVHLITPFLTLCSEDIHHRRLIISLEHRPILQELGEHLSSLNTDRTLWSHWRPGVEHVKRPLAVAQQEAAGVEPNPILVVVDHLIPAVQDEVVRAVALPGQLKRHVGEHGVGVHPPQELDLRVREEQGADERELGPESGHLGVEQRHVVEDLDAVDAAVVNLVLDGLEEVVVADRVLAWLGRGPRDEQHPGLDVVEEGRRLRVAAVPGGALLVPVGDLGAERVGRVPERPRRRVGLVVPGARRRGGGRRCGGGGGGGGGPGPGVVVLGERAVRVGDEVLAQLDEVLLRRAESAGADGAAEHDDGEEQADDGELGVPREPLDLPHPALPHHPLRRPHFASSDQQALLSPPKPNQNKNARWETRRNLDDGEQCCGCGGGWEWRMPGATRRRRRF